jgi:hypothetical protein
MKKVLTISLLVLITVFLANTVSAQPPMHDCDEHMKQHGKWCKMSANIENLRIIKLLEAVDLSEEQSEKFVPVFHQFRKDVKELRQERRTLVTGIKEMLDGTSTDDGIKTELAKLKENKKRMDDRHDGFHKDCEVILTVPQMARLMIFQEGFERQMLESLRQFRRQGGMRSDKNEEGKI